MNDTTVSRYQDGGDIYAEIKTIYGKQAANTLAQIVRETRDTVNVSTYLGELRNGPALEESGAKIFAENMTTDPFGAPLASANRALSASMGSAIKGVFSNVWVLLLAIIALVFVAVWVKVNLFPR